MRKETALPACLALATLLVAGGAAWAATATFAPAKNYPAGEGPVAISAGDLDRDRDVDLVTADFRAGTVSVLVRRADGSFRAPRAYAVGKSPLDVVARDLDGDGDKDLATPNAGDSNVSVLLGRGDGTFHTQRKYPAPSGGAEDVEAMDMDGDGDKDLITANSGGGYTNGQPNYLMPGTVSVLENRGDGTFPTRRDFVAGEAFEPQELDVGDLDGDGDRDVAVALMYVENDGGVAVLLNEGDGSLGAPQRLGAISVVDVEISDLDSDRDNDLAAADSIGSSVEFFENGGNGTFAYRDSHSVADGASTPSSLTAADLDRDGDRDLAATNFGAVAETPDSVSVLENKGDGDFEHYRAISPGARSWDGPADIVSARINADRKPDLLVANAGSDNVSVLRNTTRL